MGRLGLILLFAIFSFSTYASDSLLKQHCDRAGGEIVKGIKCPNNKIKWKSDFCITEDSSERKMFFNGCSGPSGGHAELFYPACIRHDHCYHHEPVGHGLMKKDCDRNFLGDLLAACENARNRKYCRFWAWTMYEGVRIGGALAFNCSKYAADYQ